VLVIMHRLAEYELGERLAGRTLYYLVVYPLAFFLNIGFNTSVYLLCVVVTLYASRRGIWWLASIAAGIARGPRSAGVVLAAVILYEYLRQRQWRLRKIRADILWLVLAPSGLVAFSFYCWRRLGHPFQFSTAQGYWARKLGPPWEGFWLVLTK